MTPATFLCVIFNSEQILDLLINKKIQIELLKNSIPYDIKQNINGKYYENNFKKMVKDKNILFSKFSLNIRSCNKHTHKLNLYLETLEHNFDLIDLTEIGNWKCQ